ncbi:hypothetical protein N7447_002652 [Penicillium robsamsonii]|uniref:uncharacterized protein n=1 Tax=Penicillium robsamsonii TaxID=1792511 RepID=UPI002546AAD7|nr:uncharacterized protein N7447_002652 [Penicillium robsamsonii]KAJ5836626.1 hypothetical protein N7447_002652 [Penicillium robsamsonii]
MNSIIAAYEGLSEYFQILVIGAVCWLLIPVFTRIYAAVAVGFLMIASTLGLIDWDWREELGSAPVDRIPDSIENSARLAEAGQYTETNDEKGRLEIEIESLEESLRARRDELAQ